MVLRIRTPPKFKFRVLVSVTPVLKVRPPLSIFTSWPVVGAPDEFKKFLGVSSVKFDDSSS